MKCFLLFFAFYFPWTFQSIFRKGWFKWLPSVLDICMTNGALLLSAYDRCRKASFPLHSHTGFLREELQCFCIHASFLLLSAKTSVILLQQSNQYSSWQSHRSSELLDKVISVISSRPRKLLSTTKFCIFFWPASTTICTLILSYGDCITITILSWPTCIAGPIYRNQSLLKLGHLVWMIAYHFFSICVTIKTTRIYTPNSLPIYIYSMFTLPS